METYNGNVRRSRWLNNAAQEAKMQPLPIPVVTRPLKTLVPLKHHISLRINADFLDEGDPVNLMEG